MSEMTLSSRNMIRNSNPGGLRSSTLPRGHGVLRVYGEETFLFSPNRRDQENIPEGCMLA